MTWKKPLMLKHWEQKPEWYKKDSEEQYMRLLKGPEELLMYVKAQKARTTQEEET